MWTLAAWVRGKGQDEEKEETEKQPDMAERQRQPRVTGYYQRNKPEEPSAKSSGTIGIVKPPGGARRDGGTPQSQPYQLKPTQAKASFQKVNLPPAKLGMLFHVHLSVTEFWPHIYSLSPAQSSYQTSQIRPNTRMGGACNAERSTL